MAKNYKWPRFLIASIVPAPISVNMLMLGIYGKQRDCYFGLASFFIVVGMVSVAMIMLSTEIANAVRKIHRLKKTPSQKKPFLLFFDYFGLIIYLVQNGVVFIGTFVMFPFIFQAQHWNPDQDNYCDKVLSYFSITFFSLSSVTIGLTLVVMIYMLVKNFKKEKRRL